MKRFTKLILTLAAVLVGASLFRMYSREHLAAAPGSASQKNTYSLPTVQPKVVKPKPVHIRPAPTTKK